MSSVRSGGGRYCLFKTACCVINTTTLIFTAGVHFVSNYVCFYLGVLKITLLKTTLGVIVCYQKTIPAHSKFQSN